MVRPPFASITTTSIIGEIDILETFLWGFPACWHGVIFHSHDANLSLSTTSQRCPWCMDSERALKVTENSPQQYFQSNYSSIQMMIDWLVVGTWPRMYQENILTLTNCIIRPQLRAGWLHGLTLLTLNYDYHLVHQQKSWFLFIYLFFVKCGLLLLKIVTGVNHHIFNQIIALSEIPKLAN